MNGFKFAIMGGDMRQAKLAELLQDDGHDVCVYAFGENENLDSVRYAKSTADAVQGANCIVMPLPAVSSPGVLNTPLDKNVHRLEDIFSLADSSATVLGGMINKQTYSAAREYGIEIQDYYDREELVVANAVATAEGAIKIAIEETPCNIAWSKCLIIGFGRIGKVLASRLKGLCAEVSVSARSCADIAWIDAYGYKTLNTNKLKGKLQDFDIIFNTVPARILGQELLEEINPSALIIDLSSKPGGMDFTAAGNLGLKAIWALSLPGKIAPVTSGEIIKNTIYNMLLEQGLVGSMDEELQKMCGLRPHMG